ncbi:MAG: NAD(P)H-hydrate dehydratase [Propionibacteriaceae bacterium]|nr:NAD(P)H-hydrate dehydratase [Propionibacteriaceae bacterium]
MPNAYSVPEIRRAEQVAAAEVGEDALMQRAAYGLYGEIVKLLQARRGVAAGARVLILAGPGNNGGDALYTGVQLVKRGIHVSALRITDTVHARSWKSLQNAGGVDIDYDAAAAKLHTYDLVIDGVLGIGGRPGLPALASDFAKNLPAAKVVAVDIPSGLSAELPFATTDHFKAGLTVTFGGCKPIHLLKPGSEYCGQIVCIDIGLPKMRATIQQLADLSGWPFPESLSDKYARGVVGIDAGSAQYPGAGVLCVAGAVHAGAGLVRFCGDRKVAGLIPIRFPNVVVSPDSTTTAKPVDAWVLGSGWGERKDGQDVVHSIIDKDIPTVIDADGLRHLPYKLHSNVVLTPHPGELAKLLGIARSEVEADPIGSALSAANSWEATVLLKGPNQIIASPKNPNVLMAAPGPAWTAQGGSGDVLAGVIGTLLASKVPANLAAALGASLQAIAARTHGPLPPHELVRTFDSVLLDASDALVGEG